MSRAKGDIAEQRGCSYLIEHGYTIIEQNFYSRFGEIDIIASRNGVLCFVEVKSAQEYELAVQNLTPTKLGRFKRTVDVYIKKNSYNGDYEIDALLVMPDEIIHLQNITL